MLFQFWYLVFLPILYVYLLCSMSNTPAYPIGVVFGALRGCLLIIFSLFFDLLPHAWFTHVHVEFLLSMCVGIYIFSVCVCIYVCRRIHWISVYLFVLWVSVTCVCVPTHIHVCTLMHNPHELIIFLGYIHTYIYIYIYVVNIMWVKTLLSPYLDIF